MTDPETVPEPRLRASSRPSRREEPDRAPDRVERRYWLLPALGVALGALFVVRGTSELLRFEEVAESIRNVYWLGERALYDGISTNVGWYGLLLAVYRLSGFELATAAWVRLALHGAALVASAVVLRRALSGRAAGLVVAALALSPSWLYFLPVRTSFATDLYYFPLVLLLLWPGEEPGSAPAETARSFAAGLLSALAATSYPVFLFYLPAVAWLLRERSRSAPHGSPSARPADRDRRSSDRARPPESLDPDPIPPRSDLRRTALLAAAAVAGFLVPLLAAYLWLEDRGQLVHDPATGAGLFRGGGSFEATAGSAARSLLVVGRDLFVAGRSYYFWLPRPELGGLALAAVTAVAVGSVLLFRRRARLRVPIGLAVLLPTVNVLAVAWSGGPPGLRRATTLLAGFYVLYALVAGEVLRGRGEGDERRAVFSPRLSRVLLAGCLLLPVHHLLVLPGNLRSVPAAGTEQAQAWFAGDDADDALGAWLLHTEAGRPLDCRWLPEPEAACAYSGIFAVLRGFREWNGSPAVPVLAYDPHSDRILELDVSTWERGELPLY